MTESSRTATKQAPCELLFLHSRMNFEPQPSKRVHDDGVSQMIHCLQMCASIKLKTQQQQNLQHHDRFGPKFAYSCQNTGYYIYITLDTHNAIS